MIVKSNSVPNMETSVSSINVDNTDVLNTELKSFMSLEKYSLMVSMINDFRLPDDNVVLVELKSVSTLMLIYR